MTFWDHFMQKVAIGYSSIPAPAPTPKLVRLGDPAKMKPGVAAANPSAALPKPSVVGGGTATPGAVRPTAKWPTVKPAPAPAPARQPAVTKPATGAMSYAPTPNFKDYRTAEQKLQAVKPDADVRRAAATAAKPAAKPMTPAPVPAATSGASRFMSSGVGQQLMWYAPQILQKLKERRIERSAERGSGATSISDLNRRRAAAAEIQQRRV